VVRLIHSFPAAKTMFGRKSKSAQPKVNRADQLQSDYAALTAMFTGHPFISIKETFGVPAEKYRIIYKIEGLQQTGKAIEAKNEHIVEILLPPGYPESPPYCKSVSPIFHPNFDADIIDIKEQWSKGMPLADLVVQIGEMIAFQKYSTSQAVNTEAGKWADRNSSILPLSTVDLRRVQPRPRVPGPAPVEIRTESGAVQNKKSEELVSNDIFVNQIVINDLDADAEETPEPEDARKTEGIVVSADTDQLTKDQVIDAAQDQEKAGVPARDNVRPQQQHSGKAVTMPTDESSKAPAGDLEAVLQAPESTPATASVAPEKSPVQKPVPPMILFQFFYCPYCGNKNNKDANFCMNCGARIKPMRKKNLARILSVIAMIVIPVVILTAGIAAVVFRVFNHTEKETIPVQSMPLQPEQEKPAIPKQAPAAMQPERRTGEEPVTAEAIASKMVKPQVPEAQKTQNVFAPGRLTEQQKNEKIAGLLQNARLYMNIGSYDDAIKRYKEVLKLNPTNFEASTGLDSAQEARDKAPPRPQLMGVPEE
jgi:ubiquitin-protein ligase